MLRGLSRLAWLGALASSAPVGWGCAKDPMELAADGGAGTGGAAGGAGSGGAGSGGAGGAATDGGADGVVVTPPACDPASSTMGAVAAPTPLVSLGKPVTASAGVTTPTKLVDGLYHNGAAASFPVPAGGTAAPPWAAIQVGAGPARLLLAWTDAGYTPYNAISGGAPAGYRIETSADSTNGQDGAWDTAITVTENPVRARAHSFPFAGKSWVRFVVTAAGMNGTTPVTPQIDEIAIHDITSSGDGRPADTWFFLGDSITQGGFGRNLNVRFDITMKVAHPGYFPVMLNGGIGGEFARDGLRHINMDGWLALNPDFQHIAILFGTNDEWGDKVAASTDFEASLTGIVEAVLADHRVPVLARIPYALPPNHSTLPSFNAIIDRISTSHGLPCGPDLYGWFQSHPAELGPDGVHPTDVGYASINRLWAEAMARFYPAN